LQGKDYATQQLAHFVTKQMKQLITCWYPVSLADKFGLLCYMILAYRHSHHKLEKDFSRIGGHLQAAEFQVKCKKG